MRFRFWLFCFLLAVSSVLGGPRKQLKSAAPAQRELEIVLCLDLSGSTNGLIEDYREHFWYINNQLMAMTPAPLLRIGVVGFSRPSFGKGNAYVKVLVDITEDLDAVSAAVFRLRRSIEKGDQHVVPALQTCINKLSWSKSEDAVRIIFLAGNGMATSNGQVYEKLCETAKSRGITINSLYVLSNANLIKELPGWKRIAEISGGQQTDITVNKVDTANVWEDSTTGSVAHNKQLHHAIRWNAMDQSCLQYSMTADSGAYVSSGDEWMNRIAFKARPQYSTFLERCGAFSAHDGKQAEALGEDVFSRKIRESVEHSKNLLKQCGNEAPWEMVQSHHALYTAGSMKENSCLRRVLILLTMQRWGELPLTQTN